MKYLLALLLYSSSCLATLELVSTIELDDDQSFVGYHYLTKQLVFSHKNRPYSVIHESVRSTLVATLIDNCHEEEPYYSCTNLNGKNTSTEFSTYYTLIHGLQRIPLCYLWQPDSFDCDRPFVEELKKGIEESETLVQFTVSESDNVCITESKNQKNARRIRVWKQNE